MGLQHPTIKSFTFAFEGLKTALRQEPNFRIHMFMAFIALCSGVYLGLTATEWIILAFTIFYVLTLELLNTVMEAVVNLVSPEYKHYAKVAKDVSAACVLLAAILSLIVGLILFLPKIISLSAN